MGKICIFYLYCISHRKAAASNEKNSPLEFCLNGVPVKEGIFLQVRSQGGLCGNEEEQNDAKDGRRSHLGSGFCVGEKRQPAIKELRFVGDVQGYHDHKHSQNGQLMKTEKQLKLARKLFDVRSTLPTYVIGPSFSYFLLMCCWRTVCRSRGMETSLEIKNKKVRSKSKRISTTDLK